MNGTKWVRMLRNVFVDGEPLLVGAVVELPGRTADALIAMGRAAETDAPAVTAQPEPQTPEDQGAGVANTAAPAPQTPERKRGR